MAQVFALARSSVGKKFIMALTGAILIGFVLGHMIGNLKVFLGAEYYNAYAEGLREVGAPFLGHSQFLWVARIGLLVAVVLHITSAVQLTRMARAARPVKYQRPVHLEDTYASRTMRWGGVVILLFVVYHLLHLTFGTVHGRFIEGDVYNNFVTGFQVIPVSLVYIASMIMLGFHMYHGLWSGVQTIGLNSTSVDRVARGVAMAIALVVVIGNISMPVAVMAGLIQ